MSRRLFLSFTLPLLLSQTACLPSSQRQNTRAVTPADSLSMRLAAEVPVDTLRLLWEAPEASPFELPTTLLWRPDSLGGELVVADTKRGSLHVLSPEGAYVEERRPPMRYPYLAGLRGDTVVVFSRGDRRLDFLRESDDLVVGDGAARQVDLPADYAAILATDDALWAKRADEDAAYLARLDEAGHEVARYALAGPYWRHIGFLRARGDTLLSLSGYRPVVDRLVPGTPEGATLDTLALYGFDSPQLVRSYQFMLDEVDQPPLLTSAAAVHGDRLFVLNLRADELRIDVYGPAEGGLRLERVLVYPAADLLATEYPVDLAVRADDGRVRFAVVLQRPGGFLKPVGGGVLMLAWDRPAA